MAYGSASPHIFQRAAARAFVNHGSDAKVWTFVATSQQYGGLSPFNVLADLIRFDFFLTIRQIARIQINQGVPARGFRPYRLAAALYRSAGV